MPPICYFVIPCFNESEVLPISAPVLREKLSQLIADRRISENSRVLFVDDGSVDDTWKLISAMHKADRRFTGVRLAHNAGEQNAYYAGLAAAVKKADVMITMDCDLQDDINAVDEMLDRFAEGYEIVFGVRRRRDEDPAIQRLSSAAFYRLMQLLKTDLIREHSQYRLMSRRAVRELMEYPEVNLFLPALVMKLGLRHTVVLHDRHARAAGKSNYTPAKLVRLAVEAVTSFSTAPFAFLTGAAVFSGVLFLVFFIAGIISGARNGAFDVPMAVLGSVWLIAALLFAGLRILAEYVGKTYAETKRRPRYHIETELD
ncbi:MAG: glycosyltransferase family 2 protein [Clostridia bacterium]|nr:glycosyltransferase family 2 protein [Clostridia bacterium]